MALEVGSHIPHGALAVDDVGVLRGRLRRIEAQRFDSLLALGMGKSYAGPRLKLAVSGHVAFNVILLRL